MSEPTHLHIPTGAHVFPEGYPVEELELLAPAEAEARAAAIALYETRACRDQLLDASDKFVMPDRPMSEEKRAEWVAYRQALRDLPNPANPANPTEIEWPTPPAMPPPEA